MSISANQVKELRDITGAGFMECKSALAETDGDIEKAVIVLRTKGQAKAAKRAGRTTAQGLIGHYIHQGGQVGVLLEMNCESDFVARTDDFKNLLKEISMHIAATDPSCLTRKEVPINDLEREKNIVRAQFKDSNKPPEVIEEIGESDLEKVNAEIQKEIEATRETNGHKV